MQCIRTTHMLSIVALSVWAAMVSYGVASLLIYDSKPGQAASAPSSFPDDFEEKEGRDRPLMVVFLHPHCPCSRATLDQLEAILVSNKQEFECRVLFVVPSEAEADPGWENGPLLERVASISGISIERDFGGTAAKRFAAATSGQVLFYGSDRSLAFSGGITAARGHLGENVGARAILNLLENKRSPSTTAPVYGCPLFNLETINVETSCGGASPCR